MLGYEENSETLHVKFFSGEILKTQKFLFPDLIVKNILCVAPVQRWAFEELLHLCNVFQKPTKTFSNIYFNDRYGFVRPKNDD